MNAVSTGNLTVDQLINVQFTGNILHHAWYRTITFPNGKPDTNGIVILGDIVYWYRPTEIRDEQTGQCTGWKKKFYGDLLQRDYNAFARLTGLTKNQVRDAIIRLEKTGVIRRVFRTVMTGSTVCSNVLFIDLNYDALFRLSFGGGMQIYPGGSRDTSAYRPQIYQQTHPDIPTEGMQKNRDTYTQNTTQITTQITTDHTQRGGGVVDKFNKEGDAEQEVLNEPEFAKFWEAYPKKVCFHRTIKEWNFLLSHNVKPIALIIAATKYAAQVKSQATEERYIKTPHKFLEEEIYKEFLIQSGDAADCSECLKYSLCKGRGYYDVPHEDERYGFRTEVCKY